MKAYLLTVLIVDHDEVGIDDIKTILREARYPNDCIAPHVLSHQESDIGEWDDDHPLNFTDISESTLKEYFKS